MPSALFGLTADAIDALLPQTQCRRCRYDSCRAYAEAVAAGDAPINRCPPGGDATVAALADLLGSPVLAIDRSCGVTTPLAIARIDEGTCIGCTLCIQACPTDAIVGAAKLMHTVIADRCTGCGLCLPPCPVDCIAMPAAARVWSTADAERARQHFSARNARLATGSRKRAQETAPVDAARRLRRAAVDAALARARRRRAAGSVPGA
ncbi:MAG TPA: RnfABCDGE type electron transport complex subunit B [Casimicrobiaceae bacterium]|nr:RnfABCDGE type electron transport complex subunit B [Casimicrobiaceae bacterium]